MASTDSFTNAFNATTMETTTSTTNYTEIFIITLKIVIGLVGTIGNMTVCVAVFQMRSKEVKFLIGSQATIDFSTSAVLVATTITSTYPQLISPRSYTAGYLYCLIWHWNGLLFFLFSLSTYNLVAISIERYMAVIHPIWYRTSFSRKKAIILGAVLWVIAPILQIVFCVEQTYYIDGTCHFLGLTPFWLAIVGVLLFCWDFFGPSLVMVVCFSRISWHLLQQDKEASLMRGDTRKGISTVSGKTTPDTKDDGLSRSRNVTKTFLTVFVAFLICWSCNQFLFLQRNVGGFLYHGTPLNHFADGMAILNCAINPCIYVFRFQQYREKIKAMFCC